jgi:hypothetical protein
MSHSIALLSNFDFYLPEPLQSFVLDMQDFWYLEQSLDRVQREGNLDAWAKVMMVLFLGDDFVLLVRCLHLVY